MADDITELDGLMSAGIAESGREIVQCPFLQALPLSSCETSEQAKLWRWVNEFATVVSGAVHDCFNRVLDKYHYGENMFPVGKKIRTYLEEKKLTYPSLRLVFGDEALCFLEETGLETRVYKENYNWSADKGLLVFQLPLPLACFWWKNDERLTGGDWGRFGDDEDEDRDRERAMAVYEKVLDKIRSLGVSTGSVKGGLGKKVIEWGDIYDQVIRGYWEAKDKFIANSDLRLTRINDTGEHDPKHYYYVMLVAGKDDTPVLCDTDGNIVDKDGNVIGLSEQNLRRLVGRGFDDEDLK